MSCFSSNQLYYMYWFEICKLEFSVCLSFVNNFSSILPTFIVPSQSPRPGTSWEICNSQCFDQCYQRQWSSHFHPERLYLWSPWNRASEQYNSICLHSSSGLSHQGKSDRVNSDLLWMHYKCKCYTMEKNSTLISVQNPYTRKLLLKLCIKCIDLHALFLCKCVNTIYASVNACKSNSQLIEFSGISGLWGRRRWTRYVLFRIGQKHRSHQSTEKSPYHQWIILWGDEKKFLFNYIYF